MKKIIIWMLSLGLFVFVLNYGFKTYSRLALEKLISSVVGLHTLIDEVDIGVKDTNIKVQDLFIFNPKKFEERRMFDIPEIYIDFDFPALFKKKIHFNVLKLNLKELTVIKLPDGDINLRHIKVFKQKKKNPKEEGINYRFDNVELGIGTVIFIDYSKKGKKRRKEYQLNLHQQLKDVDSIESLYRIVLIQAMRKTSLDKVLDLNLKSLIKPVHSVLNEAVTLTDGIIP